ncbi:MAG: hypothetical protein OXH15_06665 [Gammaproteobacteria bacterium]|nr:hypothetical protein [Gammaproteobacteria bacterium]
MATGQDDTDTPTQFDVVLATSRSDVAIPALALMLSEDRSGGWLGTVRINPRVVYPGDALQTVLNDGLVPGTAITVKLVVTGDPDHAGVAVRSWPSVVTSVNATGSAQIGGADDALCVVSFRDPLSFLRMRPVWASYVDRPLAGIVGGILSAASGGDGQPTWSPVLPGLPAVGIHEELGIETANVPYAVAAGEPMGYWLNRVCGRLGVRFEMVGDASGHFHLWLRDGAPSTTSLNRDGGIDMTFDPDRDPSATNLVLSDLGVNSRPATVRGGLLDNLSGGGARRFGSGGALGSVMTEAQASLDDAIRRGGFRRSNRQLRQVQATVTSCQPGFLPGRVVRLDGATAEDDEAEQADDRAYASLFGASRWQVADVSHACLHGRYWNRAGLEKTGLAWRPALPDEEGAAIVSGIVDDGVSPPGNADRA